MPFSSPGSSFYLSIIVINTYFHYTIKLDYLNRKLYLYLNFKGR